MKFSLVIPSSSPVYQCYADLRGGVAWALQSLGHSAELADAPVSGTRPICFGLPTKLPPDAIIFNGEPAYVESDWHRVSQRFAGHVLWDYSAENAERYHFFGLPPPAVVHPSCGPHCVSAWSELGQARHKTHDVVFFGSINTRRASVLAELQQRGLSVLRIPQGTYGPERDKLIGQARLCINVHYFDGWSVFESVRCSHLPCLGVPVVTERSIEGQLYGMWGVPYAELGDQVESCLAPAKLRELSRCQQEFRQQRASALRDQVAQALEQL